MPFLPLNEHRESSSLPKIAFLAKATVKFLRAVLLVPVISPKTCSTGFSLGGVSIGRVLDDCGCEAVDWTCASGGRSGCSSCDDDDGIGGTELEIGGSGGYGGI